MNMLKTAIAASEHEPDPLSDLLAAVNEQFEEDGTLCTPYNSAAERSANLTERWSGTVIFTHVLDGSPAKISKGGDDPILIDVGKYEEGKYFSPKPFPEVTGVIRSVSPGYGGYIELNNGWQVTLPNRGENGPLSAEELKLEITNLSAN